MATREPCCDPIVRTYTPADAPALHAAVRASIDTLSTWLPWCHRDYALDDARRWIDTCIASWRDGSGYAMGVFNADGDVLGGVGLSDVDRAARTANLGYWVADAHRGRGVATSAARRMARIAFDELGFARLEIAVLAHNAASLRVADKLGARFVGETRDRLAFQGRPAPARVYALEPALLGHRS